MANLVRVRLEDKKSGERRSVGVGMNNVDAAVQLLEEREQEYVGFQIDPSRALELERKFRNGGLSGRDKAQLLMHHQDRPYRVVKAQAA